MTILSSNGTQRKEVKVLECCVESESQQEWKFSFLKNCGVELVGKENTKIWYEAS